MSPKVLLAQIADSWKNWRLWDSRLRGGDPKSRPDLCAKEVGRAILDLDKKDRDIIRQLKAKDIKHDKLTNEVNKNHRRLV